MATMTVSLPDPMKDWIEAQIKTGDYASSSDYVRDLVRRDREQKDKLTALRRLIDDAEASGISPRTLDEVFADARARARKRGLLNE
ncbi:type II toxin-antitoxin system ParD family antitoxin [Lichenihabitans sp. Uapishka_5]|uniref:type II toxin-antitoxin system ParD family antitoxin n=1 Tax=Lichenihabitans sp. Uapishka_5 TaxID=3037302 RepID=UPI0029E7CB2D|nr:type II toxin-antitoxin system ParD family antitoxin [Lichenihabitans sp. Uapishka_5]MDX7951794.1 type II toxin-antitoxin system ParD family antitoxin [Lichenihabitans sp. Uapishka_5]